MFNLHYTVIQCHCPNVTFTLPHMTWMQHGTENTWTEGTVMPHQGASALFPVGHLRRVLAKALRECVTRILLFLMSHTHIHTYISAERSGCKLQARVGFSSDSWWLLFHYKRRPACCHSKHWGQTNRAATGLVLSCLRNFSTLIRTQCWRDKVFFWHKNSLFFFFFYRNWKHTTKISAISSF